MARFLESRGMLEDALEIATDPDYRFDLAVQLGRLDDAKVRHDWCCYMMEGMINAYTTKFWKSMLII